MANYEGYLYDDNGNKFFPRWYVGNLPSGTDGRDYWNNLQEGYYWYGNTSAVENMPNPWGWVIKIGFYGTADFSVLFFTQSSGAIYRKSGNGTSISGWVRIDAIGVAGLEVKSASSVTTLGWGTNNNYLADISMLSYWNGAYSDTKSNLTYCIRGPIRGASHGRIYWNRQTVNISATWTNTSFGNVTTSLSKGRITISGSNIVIGSGVTRVKITLSCVGFYTATGGDRVSSIMVGNAAYNIIYTSGYGAWSGGGSGSIIVDVTSGTTITAKFQSGITGSFEHLGAWLIVEDMT